MILFYILFLFSYASDDDCAFDLTHREPTGLKNRLGDLFEPSPKKIEQTKTEYKEVTTTTYKDAETISVPKPTTPQPAPIAPQPGPAPVQHPDIFPQIKAGHTFSFTATCKGQKDTYRQWTDNPVQYTIDRTALPVPDETFSFRIFLEGNNIVISGHDLRGVITDRGSIYLDGTGTYIGRNGYLSNTGEVTFHFMTHRGWAGGEYHQIKWTCKHQII